MLKNPGLNPTAVAVWLAELDAHLDRMREACRLAGTRFDPEIEIEIVFGTVEEF